MLLSVFFLSTPEKSILCFQFSPNRFPSPYIYLHSQSSSIVCSPYERYSVLSIPIQYVWFMLIQFFASLWERRMETLQNRTRLQTTFKSEMRNPFEKLKFVEFFHVSFCSSEIIHSSRNVITMACNSRKVQELILELRWVHKSLQFIASPEMTQKQTGVYNESIKWRTLCGWSLPLLRLILSRG